MNKKLIDYLTDTIEQDVWHEIKIKTTFEEVNKSLNSFAELGLAIRFNDYNRALIVFSSDKYKEFLNPVLKIIESVQDSKKNKIVPMGCFLKEITDKIEIEKETLLFSLAVLITNQQIVEHNTINNQKIYYLK